MFITLARSDTIRVAPQYLVAGGTDKKSTDLETILSQEIDIKYADTVLPGYGLVLCLWAIDEIKDATVMPGDGGAYTFVRFRLLVFCPEPNEVIVAKVKAVDPKGGVRCSVDFFMDIVVPPHLLPEGVVYNAAINGYSMAQDPNETSEPPDFRVDDYVRIKISSVLYRAAKTGGAGEGSSAAVTAPPERGPPGQQAQSAQPNPAVSLAMLDVAGAAAAVATAEANPAKRFELKGIPTQQPIIRPGVLIVGSSSTDGAMLPTAATVAGSTALIPPLAPAAGAAAGKPAPGAPASLPPSYSALPPPAITKPISVGEAAGLADARQRYSLSSSDLICPPLAQAFTTAGTSTWRLETGIAASQHATAAATAATAAANGKKDGKKASAASTSNSIILAAAAAALRAGHGGASAASSSLPDYLRTAEPLAPAIAPSALGAQRRLGGGSTRDTAAGVERFYTRDAVSNVLMPQGGQAAAVGESSSSSSGGGGASTTMMVAGGPAALLAPFLKGREGAPGMGASYNPPMAVIASMKGTCSGLGPLGWWEGDENLDYLPQYDHSAPPADQQPRADGTFKLKVLEDAVTRVGKAFAPLLGIGATNSGSATTSAAATAVEPLDETATKPTAATTTTAATAVDAAPSAKRARKGSSDAAASAEGQQQQEGENDDGETAASGDGSSGSSSSSKRGGRGGSRGGGRGGSARGGAKGK
jgi:trimeric autotransporter adhesin